jgi:hypothetical protein
VRVPCVADLEDDEPSPRRSRDEAWEEAATAGAACIFDDNSVVYGYSDEKAAPLELHRVLQGGHAPLSRFVGSCRIELHSLQRTELNGRQGVILPLPPPPHERVPVQLDGSVPAIKVKPQNILILAPDGI